MLRTRLLVAISILIPLLGLLVADFRWNGGAPGVWLAPFCLVVSLAAAAEILDLLRWLNQQRNLTIVMVTHDNSLAAAADRVVRLAEGRVELVR